jgi:very-short-patch-repair endonuclease
MGFELLRAQTFAAVAEDFMEMDGWVRGDSEIEKLFHAALFYRISYGRTEFDDALIAIDKSHASRLRANTNNRLKLIVESQVEIERFRVDFVVSAWTDGIVFSGAKGWQRGDARWRSLVVECDGHDFHERTKEQAAKDRSRDRSLSGQGYDVFRFTGSELWRDPWGCADQVYDWAVRGFDFSPELPE